MSGWLEALLGKILNSGVSIPLSKGLNFTTDIVAALNQSTKQIDVSLDPAAVARSFPGAPVYDVTKKPFNAVGDGVSDDTAAVSAAITAANATGGTVFFGRAHLFTGALPIVTGNNVTLQGRGRYDGGTALRFALSAAPASGAWIEIWGQYSGIQDCWITGYNAVITTGCALRMANFQGYARRLLFTGVPMGVEVLYSTLLKIDRVTVQDTYGPDGILVHGMAGVGVAHATWIADSLFTNAFPGAVIGTITNWATSTAYIVGNVVVANGNIYQCTTAGTSAGSGIGPSGIPGPTVFNAHSVTLTDGTAQWVFAMPFNDWIHQDAYSHTCRVIDCAFLQGGRAIRMTDTSAGVSKPEFLRCLNVEIDHCVGTGISLEGGQQAEFEQTFITSMYQGRAIDIASTFTGGWRFNGGYIFAGLVELVSIAAPDGILSGMIIGAGGLLTSNTYDAVRVASGTERFTISDNSIGRMPGSPSPSTRYGINVGASCDNYSVQGNRLQGHVTAPLLNTPGVGLTRVVRNNEPDSGMRWGGTASVTLTSGTTNTITIPDGVTFYYVSTSGAGPAFVDEIVYGGGNTGARVWITKNTGSGSVVLRPNPGKGANQITPPGNVDWRLNGALSSVEVGHNGSSWCLEGRQSSAATISVPVPAVAAGTLAYLNVSTVGTALEGIGTTDVVVGAPAADLAAAGAGNGDYVGCRVSAASTLRLTFQGTLAGGSVNFVFSLLT
jgi:hypothetical protein